MYANLQTTLNNFLMNLRKFLSIQSKLY